MKRKEKGVKVEIEVPEEVVEKVGEEKLAELFKTIIETHAKTLRMIMESKKE